MTSSKFNCGVIEYGLGSVDWVVVRDRAVRVSLVVGMKGRLALEPVSKAAFPDAELLSID